MKFSGEIEKESEKITKDFGLASKMISTYLWL